MIHFLVNLLLIHHDSFVNLKSRYIQMLALLRHRIQIDQKLFELLYRHINELSSILDFKVDIHELIIIFLMSRYIKHCCSFERTDHILDHSFHVFTLLMHYQEHLELCHITKH